MGRRMKKKSHGHQSCHQSDSKGNDKRAPALLSMVDRLSLPLYIEKEPDADFEDADELRLTFRNRPHFVCSLCRVCDKECDDIQFRCVDCLMVYYCSEEHKQQNLPRHKSICSILSDVCIKNDGILLAQNLNPEEYRGFRLGLLQIVQDAIGRPLELWEKEVLLFPRLCRVCHGFNNLKRCSDCLMEYFCVDNPEHSDGHKNHCLDFQIYRRMLTSISGKIINGQKQDVTSIPRMPTVYLKTSQKLPKNFDHLMLEIFQSLDNDRYSKLDCASYLTLSHLATPCLTATYALDLINHWKLSSECKKTDLVIHIIGAELQFECADLSLWEKILMHRHPELRQLRLEICGPEFHAPNEVIDFLSKPRLCTKCELAKREIHIKFHCGKLYHDIDYDIKPDLICLFNPGLYRITGFDGKDTWPKTIEKFCGYQVPVLVTSYTELELPLDIHRICDEFKNGTIKVDIPPQLNPFASLRPDRNFVSDDATPLIYKNYLLGIVRGSHVE